MKNLQYYEYERALILGNTAALKAYLSHLDVKLEDSIEQEMYEALFRPSDKTHRISPKYLQILKEHVEEGLRDEKSLDFLIDLVLE